MRHPLAGVPGRATTALLMLAVTLSFLWPRYVFFSLGGPYVNPLTVTVLMALMVALAWVVYSPGLTRRMGLVTSGVPGMMWLLLAWLVWRALASLLGRYPEASLFELFRDTFYLTSFLLFGWILSCHPNGVRAMLRCFTVCAALLIVAGLVEAWMQKNYFVNFGSGRTDSQAVSGALRVIMSDKARDGAYRVQATFDHPIVCAQFMAVAILVFGYWSVRARSLLARLTAICFVLMGCVVIYKTGSRAGIAGLLVGIGFLGLLYWIKLIRSRGMGRAMALVVLPALLVGLVTLGFLMQQLIEGRSRVEASSSSVRLEMLRAGVDALVDAPFLGFGTGSALVKAGVIDRATGQGTIDSLLLSFAIDSGYVGLALFVLAMAVFLVMGTRAALRERGGDAALIAVLVASVVTVLAVFVTLSITSNLTLLWLLMAMTWPFLARPGQAPAGPP
jgi:O-antigen ligase